MSLAFGDLASLSSLNAMQVARDIPYSALQFMTFEYLKKRSAPDHTLDKDKRFTKRLVHDLCIGAVCLLTVLMFLCDLFQLKSFDT
jgi:hypothetical protein